MAENLFDGKKKVLIGMVHTLPLPGSPNYEGDFQKILDRAVSDAKTLQEAGFDAVIVENMNDAPASAKIGKIQTAALTSCACAVRDAVSIPMGIDAAFVDPEASLAIAAVSGACFIRDEVFVDTVLFPDGIIYPTCREAIETRNRLGLQDIKILADVQVKHTHMLTEVPITDSMEEAEANGADILLVTGAVSGMEAPTSLIELAKKTVSIPVYAGSGVKSTNIKQQLAIADGAIIGSSIKRDGNLMNPVDLELARKVVDAL